MAIALELKTDLVLGEKQKLQWLGGTMHKQYIQQQGNNLAAVRSTKTII